MKDTNASRAVNTIVNMYNINDSATSFLWQAGQGMLKPWPEWTYNNEGNGFYRDNNYDILSVKDDYDQIFAYICGAKSKSLGAEANLVGEVINKEVDLGEDSDCGFTDADADHSAQFISYFAKRRSFWLILADKLELKIEE